MKIKVKNHDYLLEKSGRSGTGLGGEAIGLFFPRLQLKIFSFKYCASCDKENSGGLGTFGVGQED